jgi:hypothetical protein
MKFSFSNLLFLSIVLGNHVLSQTLKRIDLGDDDVRTGHYLVVEPENKNSIDGVLFLLAGFGQRPEDTPPETKLHQVAYKNNILTVFYAGGNKLYADSITQLQITTVIKDLIKRYQVKSNAFVLGGYSAGGMIAMRYTELCSEFRSRFPIQPKGIFAVDAPIDIFTIYEKFEETVKNNYADPAVEEANRVMDFMKQEYGVPRDNIAKYSKLTAFSMNKDYGQNEKFLKNTPVRVYHDVDIAWSIKNRHQTVHQSNYEVTAELINRLTLMGNDRAEFMQSYQTGYRANGQRHPHSWSIVNEAELVEWVKKLLKQQ